MHVHSLLLHDIACYHVCLIVTMMCVYICQRDRSGGREEGKWEWDANTQFHVYTSCMCILNIMLWCCLVCVHISADIMCVVIDVVSADSMSQSATTPTATPTSIDTTSQKPG